MISLMLSLLQLVWTIIAVTVKLAWMILCTVVWITWSLLFGFSIGPKPVDVGPFRMQ